MAPRLSKTSTLTGYVRSREWLPRTVTSTTKEPEILPYIPPRHYFPPVSPVPPASSSLLPPIDGTQPIDTLFFDRKEAMILSTIDRARNAGRRPRFTG